ncbi:MAG: hypothetical protein ABIH67_01945 [Candidatus Uhrbacteria bacterium]
MSEGYKRGLEDLQLSTNRFEAGDVLSILIEAMEQGCLPSEIENPLQRIDSYLDLLIEQGHLTTEQRNAAGDILSNILPTTDVVTTKTETQEPDHGILGQLQKKIKIVTKANPDLAKTMQQLLTDHPPTIQNLYQIEIWLNQLRQSGIITDDYNKILDGFMVE